MMKKLNILCAKKLISFSFFYTFFGKSTRKSPDNLMKLYYIFEEGNLYIYLEYIYIYTVSNGKKKKKFHIKYSI